MIQKSFKKALIGLSKKSLSFQEISTIRETFGRIFLKISQQPVFNEEIVKLLIREADHRGDTLLHSACAQQEPNISLITFLLENRASIKAQNRTLQTPLHYAVFSNHKELIELLFTYGANPNSKMITGMTPFHYACMSGDKKLVELFLKNSANPNIQNNKGLTPLHCVCELDPEKCVLKNDTFATWEEDILAIICLLVDSGAELERADDNGRTPLYWACFHQHESRARLLLELGALLVDNKHGDSALEWVCYKGNCQIAQLLLQKSANFAKRNRYGETLLHLAAENNPELVEVLLEKGVDPTIADLKGNSPMHKACTVMNYSMKKITLNQFIKIINLFINFIEKKHGTKTVFEMITAKNSDGFTPMMIAGKYWNKTKGSEYIRVQDEGYLTEAFDQMTMEETINPDSYNKIMDQIFEVCDGILEELEELSLKEIN